MVAFVIFPFNANPASPIRRRTAPRRQHPLRGRRWCRALPTEFALRAIGPEEHIVALRTVIVATAFAMAVVPNIPDADRAHEIKLEAADVDIGTAFDHLR